MIVPVVIAAHPGVRAVYLGAAFVRAPRTGHPVALWASAARSWAEDVDAAEDCPVGGGRRGGGLFVGMGESGFGGRGLLAVSVGRGVGDIPLAFMTSVAVGSTVCVGRNVAVAGGEAVAEGTKLGEGVTVASLLSGLAVTVRVLVAVAIWSVGVADGSVVGVAVAVLLGATTACWEVAVGPGARSPTGASQPWLVAMTLATLMPATIISAIAAWAQDGRQREKPE